jgi:hypothetical protein
VRQRGERQDWHPAPPEEEDEIMNFLWAAAVVFFVLWVLGFAAFHVTSGLVHVLLVLAAITVLFRLVAGRRTV